MTASMAGDIPVQVAPLQSPLPLVSGDANVKKARSNMQKINPIKCSVDKCYSRLFGKEKSTKKEIKGMGFAHRSI